MDEANLEYIESKILKSVKFVDVIIKETRRENKELQESLGMSYAKYIGLTSPFEEAIRSLRDVRVELNSYLVAVRGKLESKYKRKYATKGRKQGRQRVAISSSPREVG